MFPVRPFMWAVKPVTVSITKNSAAPHRRSISMVLLRKRKTRPSAERSVAAAENKKVKITG